MVDDRLGDRSIEKEMIILDGTLDGEEIKNKHLKKAHQIENFIKKKN